MGMDTIYRLSLLLSLTDDLTGGLGDAAGRVSEETEKMNQAFGTVQKSGALIAGVGLGITSACVATATATFETQDALGELASLGVTDLKAVEAAAKSFSDTWAGTSKADFINASYDIKSGIASLTDQGVAEFTRLAALTGKATKSSTEEMGSLFATGYGIYKGAYEDMSDLEFGEMFSAGISTAVKNYKTAGSEMASAISVLGATATNNKIAMEEQLAILGQLQTTMSGSEAATKYKAFLNQAASAGGKLGLSFVDANNQLLTTPEILDQLKTKYGDTIDAVEKMELKTAFGTDEAVAMIDLLYADIDGLQGGIESLSDSMQEGIGVTEGMAEAINNTPAQKFQVLKQQIHNNVEELGNALLPTINQTLDTVSGAVQKMSDWISKNQELVSTIMNIALRAGVVLAVLGTLIGIIGTLGKAVIGVKSAITAVKMAVTTLKGAWTALSAGFAASPIGWVVIAIVALVAVFAILWNTSEAFRQFWIGLFDKVQSAVMEAWSTLQPALQKLGQKLMELYEVTKPILEIIGVIAGAVLVNFVAVFVGAIQGVIAALTPLTDALSNLISFVSNIINMIVALFKGDFSGACDFASAAVDDLKNFIVNSFEVMTSFIGGFADGFLNVVGSALSAVGIDAEAGISQAAEFITSGLNGIKDTYAHIMGAAGSTVKEKLANIKTAYEQNGGGIKGITAATLTAVNSIYSAGFSFLDNLTGGKLTEIKNKFANGLQGAHDAVIEKVESIKQGFTGKLEEAFGRVQEIVNKIKGLFGFSVSIPDVQSPNAGVKTGGGSTSTGTAGSPKAPIKWHASGGIMNSPTIFGAVDDTLLGGGEAGQEAILPLSPFWDKLGQFIHTELDGGQQDGNRAGNGIVQALASKETKTVSSTISERETERYITSKEGTTINKIEVKVDLDSIKELPMLLKLIDELKDSQNSAEKSD